MPDKERNSIEAYAKMIIRMTTPYLGSYYQQAKRLYPKIGRAKHVLLAELLQAILSSPRIMYHFSIEFLELAVSCLWLGEGGCDCTALAIY